MNGRRAELIRLPEFEVEPDEAQALLAIQAETLADFAAAVEQLMNQRKSPAVQTEGPYVVTWLWPSPASPGAYIAQPQ